MKRIQPLPFFKLILQWAIVLTAILLPFAIIRLYPKFFHSSDVDDFYRWSLAWAEGWQNIYVVCDRCNYPFLGTFFSAGVISFIHIENFLHLAVRFRYYLAAIDALNVIFVWLVLSRLRVKNSVLWAGIIGLLPSSWLGASVWAQIDGLGQSLILSFYILIIWFNLTKRSIMEMIAFSILAGGVLSAMLLMKQLIYFSVFALGVILIANIYLTSNNLRVFMVLFLTIILSILVPIVLIDISLNLKEPYFSHIHYILATGSQHGDTISYVGMNIWTFFAEDLLGSSRAPLPITIGSRTLFSIVPYFTGLALFILSITMLTFFFGKYIRSMHLRGFKKFHKNAILLSFVYLALVNLSFNLTLTGVHERYLYHFYPFIIIACLGWMHNSRYFNHTMFTLLLFGALGYGLFLFGYLNSFVKPTSNSTLQGMTFLNLYLFFYLSYSVMMEIKSQSVSKQELVN